MDVIWVYNPKWATPLKRFNSTEYVAAITAKLNPNHVFFFGETLTQGVR